MFRLFFGSVMLMFVSWQSAFAQSGIDPRCSKMRDKIGCTCAVQNGGYIDGQNRWFGKRYKNAPTNEAFVQCRARNGKK